MQEREEFETFEFEDLTEDNSSFVNFEFGATEEKPKLFLDEDVYIKSNSPKLLKENQILAEYAAELAKKISLKKGERAIAYVNGSFIFGDFIQELIYNFNFKINELTISTLSLNLTNIDGLVWLFKWGNIKKLNLIISDYFYSHYRNTFVKEMIKIMEDYNFEFAVCRTHTKVALFDTEKGNKCSIYGSANLRSSNCLEMFTIEENSEVYDFHYEIHRRILDKYKVSKKTETGNKLFKTISEKENGKEKDKQG